MNSVKGVLCRISYRQATLTQNFIQAWLTLLGLVLVAETSFSAAQASTNIPTKQLTHMSLISHLAAF